MIVRRLSIVKLLLLAVLSICITSSNCFAQEILPADNGIQSYHPSPHYRESESHPLRIVGYALHPVGWALREGIFRPISSLLSSNAATRSIFGYRQPVDYRTNLCFAEQTIPNCREFPPLTMIGWKGGEHTTASGFLGGEAQTFGGEENSSAAMVSSNGMQVHIPDVAFDFNKGGLSDLGRGRVRQVAQLLASVPELEIVVEGHTDFKGTDDYNQALGQKRASSVISELVELGIDPARMSGISLGEGEPVFTEEEDWARAVNRSVRFSVRDAKEMKKEMAEEEVAG